MLGLGGSTSFGRDVFREDHLDRTIRSRLPRQHDAKRGVRILIADEQLQSPRGRNTGQIVAAKSVAETDEQDGAGQYHRESDANGLSHLGIQRKPMIRCQTSRIGLQPAKRQREVALL